jgi:ABC-type histidine transport system ATPase subunit
MQELSAEGMTMLVVTHEMGFARRVADRVIFLDNGVIAAEGPPQEILENPSMPRLQKFLGAIAGDASPK